MTEIIGPAKASEIDTVPSVDAIAFLEQEHADVAEMFAKFEDAEDPRAKLKLAEEICGALKVHAQIEEEIFYPAAEDALSDTEQQHLLQEAEVEHDTVKGLIASIEESVEDPLFEAKVTVLNEYVTHHVEEEENELFPKLADSDMDLESVGQRLAERKAELLGELEIQGNGQEAADDTKEDDLEAEDAPSEEPADRDRLH